MFNLIRNIAKPTLYPLVFVGFINPSKILQMTLVVFISTIVFQKLDWKLVAKYRYLWSFL